jgi:membrane-bound ClpP family serine protease
MQAFKILIILLMWTALGWAAPTPQSSSSSQALLLEIQGAIGPASRDFILNGLEQARERKVAVVILQIDTPGGLDSSMRDIIQAILASPVPVIGYVAPEGARVIDQFTLHARPSGSWGFFSRWVGFGSAGLILRGFPGGLPGRLTALI